jgi:hypothetical protein
MKITKSRVQKIIKGCILAVATFTSPAFAGSPVVIEHFGYTGCSDDLDMQKRVYEAVRERDDVIFLNCRLGNYVPDRVNLTREQEAQLQKEEAAELNRVSLEKYGVPLFFNEFCTQRVMEYVERNQESVLGNFNTIVNGRWISSRYDVIPAVKLGTMDGVKEIEIVRDGDVIHVTLPEGMSLPKEGGGFLKLFAYAPSTGVKVGEKIDAPEIDTTRTKLIARILDDHKRLVPLKETDERDEISPEEAKEARARKERNLEEGKRFFFRPVVAMKDIGAWNDSKVKYDVSVSDMVSQSGIDLEKLGFIVLLQSGDGHVAHILGAGEIVPLGEQM